MKSFEKNIFHVLGITIFVHVLIFAGSLIPFKLSFLNPFSKSLLDYDFTDIIYSKFKPDNDFDDRIVIINTGEPHRGDIARAIEKISSYGPKAIGVDVLFQGAKDPKQDSVLRSIIEKTTQLTLADKLDLSSANSVPHFCDSIFCQGDNFGFVNFVAKPDHTIRFYSPSEEVIGEEVEAFSTSIVKNAAPVQYQSLKERECKVEQIDYRGNIDSYVHLEMSQLLSDQDFSTTLHDKIVLMGYLGDEIGDDSVKDKYYSPMNKKMALKTLPDMFGVVIHANIISAILDGALITRASKKISLLLSFTTVLILVFILRYIFFRINSGYWKLIRLIQLLTLFGLFILSTVLMYFFHYRIGVTLAVIGVALSSDCFKFYENIFIRRQKFFKSEN